MNVKTLNKRRLISVIACLSVQLCVGIIYLWSVFSAPVRQQYLLSEGLANFVSSVMIFGFVLGNLIGGFIQDKTNPRLVATIGCALFCIGILTSSFLTTKTAGLIFLTYSVIAGMGSGFAYASVLSCLQRWFPQRRGFASGLSVAAFGMSTVVFSSVSSALLDNYSISIVFRILAAIFFIILLLACCFMRLPKEESASSVIKTGKTPLEAIKTFGFWCIFFSSFFINATWNVLVPLIKPLGTSRGLSAAVAGLAVTFTGITNACGRLSMASLSDKFKRTTIMIIMAASNAGCAVLLIWAQSWLFVIVVLFTAFSFGGPAATMPAMSVDLFGTKYSGTNYGLILLSLGFSSIIFTSISNALKSATGSYTISFILTAVCAVISIVLMIIYAKLYNIKKPVLTKEDCKIEQNNGN